MPLDNEQFEAMKRLLARIHNSFAKERSGDHYTYLGQSWLEEIQKVLGDYRPHIKEMPKS